MTIHNITMIVKPTIIKTIKQLLNCNKLVLMYNEWDNKFGFMSDVRCTDKTINEKVHQIMRCKLGDLIIMDLIACPMLEVQKLVELKHKGVDILNLIESR